MTVVDKTIHIDFNLRLEQLITYIVKKAYLKRRSRGHSFSTSSARLKLEVTTWHAVLSRDHTKQAAPYLVYPHSGGLCMSLIQAIGVEILLWSE
jgi:hypothetical protein